MSIRETTVQNVAMWHACLQRPPLFVVLWLVIFYIMNAMNCKEDMSFMVECYEGREDGRSKQRIMEEPVDSCIWIKWSKMPLLYIPQWITVQIYCVFGPFLQGCNHGATQTWLTNKRTQMLCTFFRNCMKYDNDNYCFILFKLYFGAKIIIVGAKTGTARNNQAGSKVLYITLKDLRSDELVFYLPRMGCSELEKNTIFYEHPVYLKRPNRARHKGHPSNNNSWAYPPLHALSSAVYTL